MHYMLLFNETSAERAKPNDPLKRKLIGVAGPRTSVRSRRAARW
jgi:hypothetical protein